MAATTAAMPSHAEEATAMAPVQEAIAYVGVSHDEIGSSTDEQSFSHTERLNCDTADVWEVCKHAVALLPDLAPEYYSKAEFLKGSGGPGSISILHFATPGAGYLKQRIDKVDNETKTLGYTVVNGDESSNDLFTAALHFAPTSDGSQTEATWTVKSVAIGGADPPESALKLVIVTLKTFEKAVVQKRVVRYSQTLDASADALWNILMHEDVVLPKVIPHIISSFEYLEGNGEVGSIRLMRLGEAIPGGKHVIERVDYNDHVTKTWGYTVLHGDPKYKYLSAVMQFLPGPEIGTTLAKWVGVYVPHASSIPPPDLALHVWKVFENVAKTSPQPVF